jgi:hypothetical protein
MILANLWPMATAQCEDAAAIGTQDFTQLTGPYFGQKPPGNVPELFMHGLMSTDLDSQYCISFLDQGRVSVFGREDIGVVYTYLKDDHWTTPIRMDFDISIGEWKHNTGPDDKTLYFMSPGPINDKDTREDTNIYGMTWTGSGWTEQELLPFPPNSMKYNEIYASMAKSGSLYFHSGAPRNGEVTNDDLYYCPFVDGKYQDQKHFGYPINTEYSEFDTYIAPDESYMLYSSNRPGGVGSYDIYIAYRKEDGSWSAPINPGEPVNSPAWEGMVSVTPDGKYVFFISNRHDDAFDQELLKQNERTYATGFFWVDASFIEQARELVSRESSDQ